MSDNEIEQNMRKLMEKLLEKEEIDFLSEIVKNQGILKEREDKDV